MVQNAAIRRVEIANILPKSTAGARPLVSHHARSGETILTGPAPVP